MTDEASRYGTGADDLSEAEPERASYIGMSRYNGPEPTNITVPFMDCDVRMEVRMLLPGDVTDEMKTAGLQAANYGAGSVADVYRAMAAVAPVAPTWDEIGQIGVERDAALARAEAAEKEREKFRTALCTTIGKLMVAEQRLAAEDRAVDRVGPADEVHQNFNRAVQDVLAGKVVKDARRQIQESLKVAPKDPRPFPVNVPNSDRRKVGW